MPRSVGSTILKRRVFNSEPESSFHPETLLEFDGECMKVAFEPFSSVPSASGLDGVSRLGTSGEDFHKLFTLLNHKSSLSLWLLSLFRRLR